MNIIYHPLHLARLADWAKWRLLIAGGDEFVHAYTKRTSTRENEADFQARKAITAVPSFAISAINEVKNAIFERMKDVVRANGSSTYQNCVAGQNDGVDLAGSKMNLFVGESILPELLLMGKIGVYVDNFAYDFNESKASATSKHPYFYTYPVEHILSWNKSRNNVLTAVLLKDCVNIVDVETDLISGQDVNYRYLFIGPDGLVHVRIHDSTFNLIGEEKTLNLKKIPFVVFEISESLLKNVANHQISLLNLESTDISFLMRGNTSIYVEEYDPTAESSYLKKAQTSYENLVKTGSVNGETSLNSMQVVDPESGVSFFTSNQTLPQASKPANEVIVGANQGRRFPAGLSAPSFIHPSTEPIKASMEKQDRLKADIRELVHFALSNIRSSVKGNVEVASGLAYIAVELENGENQLAEIWAEYENGSTATIQYPHDYDLSNQESTIKILTELRDELPSNTAKKEINKQIARLQMQTFVSSDVLSKINSELQNAPFYTSNPKTIQTDVEAGLASVDTGSLARGYPEGEANAAKDDHAERLARIQDAQIGTAAKKVGLSNAEAALKNPAARGLTDLSGNPTQDSAAEKIGTAQRGEGK